MSLKDKYIPGGGPIGAELLILHESPTMRDCNAGKMMEDREVNDLLRDVGINPHNCWRTYVSKHYIPPNAKKGRKLPFTVRAKQFHGEGFLDNQISELQSEFNQLKPNCVLALGSGSLWALKGTDKIKQYRGSILSGMGRKFVATYNPGQLSWGSETPPEFDGYKYRAIMMCDAKRALRESKFPEINRPQRFLQICKSYTDLLSFYERYKDKELLSIDIESGGTMLPICIGLAFSKSHGMTIPLWNANNISSLSDQEMVKIWILLSYILTHHKLIGQNFRGYDTDKLRNIGFATPFLAHDVMMKVFAINPEFPVGLAFNTSIYTEEPYYKEEGMYHGKIEDLFIGCARDACVTYEINEVTDKDLWEIGQDDFYHNFLMKLPGAYEEIQRQGFRVDTEERDNLIRKYIEWDERLRYELFKLTGAEINTSSPKQVAILLFDTLKLPPKSGTGEEQITELLNSPKTKDETVRRILENILESRRVKKSISTYLMALPDYDGRMRTTYSLTKETGRTSTGQLEPPIRPLIEVIDENGKKKDKPIGIAYQTMTKHGDVGADIRGMYVPDNTHVEVIENKEYIIEEDETFIQLDSAQAEARVIFLLADDEEALVDIDTRDYHALTASWFFGGTEDNYSKKKLGYEHPIRFVGKTLRHAGHLGAGPKRAAISVNTDARKFGIPITIDDKTAKKALSIFHTKQPRIQKVFQHGIVECLKRNRTLIAGLPYGIDSKYGGRRVFYERWGDELFRQAFSYIPQRSVSDNTKNAILRLKHRIPGIKIVMEAHDGVLISCPNSQVAEVAAIGKQEMERPIDFSSCSLSRRELVIPCEVETGKNYRDLSKFKNFINISKLPEIRELTLQEKFQVAILPRDTKRDNDIYYHTVEKKELRKMFYVD